MNKTIFLIAAIILILILAGCSTITPEQAEWNQGIDLENYNACYQGGGIFVHENHSHRNRVHWSDIRQDLWNNQCKGKLGQHWIPY